MDKIRIPIITSNDIVTARQKGRAFAAEAGLLGGDLTLVATAISEIARNIIEYAQSGELGIELDENGPRRQIVIVARDTGPGIADIPKAMQDGYSSKGSLGMGLPGTKRLMDAFEIVSEPGKGTTVTMKKWIGDIKSHPTPMIEWGLASAAAAGQIESGDKYLVKPFPGGALVAVADGLGIGPGAVRVAKMAIAILDSEPQESVTRLMERCHENLRNTRGVVMSLSSFNSLENTMTWLGVGNVEGVLLHAGEETTIEHKAVWARGGVLGDNLPRLNAVTIPIKRGDTLIFATDGVRQDFVEGINLGDPPQAIADRIRAQYFKGADDALVLVVRYRGESNDSRNG